MTAPLVRDAEDGLATISCTACGATVLADPVAARRARLWHYGDGTHAVVQERRSVREDPSGSALRADVLGLAVRLQDLADDVAELANRLP